MLTLFFLKRIIYSNLIRCIYGGSAGSGGSVVEDGGGLWAESFLLQPQYANKHFLIVCSRASIYEKYGTAIRSTC